MTAIKINIQGIDIRYSRIDQVEIEKQLKTEQTWQEELKNKLKADRILREEERNRTEELEKLKQERISQSNEWISQGLCSYCGKKMTGLFSNECKSCIYKVGDIGPAGGIIFYDQGYISDGWRFLEAAPANTEFEPKWIGVYEKHGFGVTPRRYKRKPYVSGTGKTNTLRIMKFFRTIIKSGKIAQLCVTLNVNGYNDWFLPSQEELNLIYANLKKKNLGEFKDGYYWSSTLYDGNNAWGRFFTDGYQLDLINGDYKDRIRAVRRF